jgi:hypothetical protein
MPPEPGNADPTSGQGGEPPAGDPPAQEAPPAAPPTNITFTPEQQAVLNNLLTREAAKAERAAARKLLEQAGFSKAEELVDFVTKTKEAERAQMTEAERKLAEAADKEAAAEAKSQEATKVILGLNVKEALIDAGVPTKDADRVKAMVTVGAEATKEDIATAVTELKAEMPHLFGASRPGGAPSSEPASGGAPAGGPQPLSALDAGKARAAQRNEARGIKTS